MVLGPSLARVAGMRYPDSFRVPEVREGLSPDACSPRGALSQDSETLCTSSLNWQRSRICVKKP